MRARFGRILIGLLVVALLFTGLELLLGWLDLGRGPLVYAPGGLRHDARYLVPDPEVPGGWVTRFNSPVYGERHVPPRGAGPRIVLLGASNTRSFGLDLPRDLLARATGRDWDVVNLGRSGYGSERIMLIAREVMADLEPDILMLYTGDNEFVDYGAFASTGVVQPDIRIDRRVLGLRTVGLLRDLVRPVRPGDHPEPMVLAPPDKVGHLTLEQARRHVAHLRDNLEAILDEARQTDVRIVLLTVLYNRFAPPDGNEPSPDLAPEDRAALEEGLRRAEALVPEALRPVFFEPNGTMLAKHWKEVTEPPATLPMIDPMAWRRPACGPLSDARAYENEPWQWSPRVWTLIGGLDALHRRAFSGAERGDLEEMERILGALVARCPDHPRAQWMLGMVQLALDRDPEAIERHLVLAAALDRAPRKSSETVNDIIRSVAADHSEVLFLDADRRVADLVPGRTLGYEWMLDHCHLSIGARTLVLGDMAAAIARRWPDVGLSEGAR